MSSIFDISDWCEITEGYRGRFISKLVRNIHFIHRTWYFEVVFVYLFNACLPPLGMKLLEGKAYSWFSSSPLYDRTLHTGSSQLYQIKKKMNKHAPMRIAESREQKSWEWERKHF